MNAPEGQWPSEPTPRWRAIPGGTVLARFPFPVELSKVRELDVAFHDPRGVSDDLASYDRSPVTPAFTFTSAHWHDRPRLFWEVLGLDALSLLHGGQRWRIHRPLAVGDRLQATTRLAGIDRVQGRNAGRMDRITVRTSYVDDAGSEVLVEDHVLLQPERPVGGGPPPRTAPDDGSGNDTAIDTAIRTIGPISRQDIVRCAGATGDFQLVHVDETFARAAGHPGVFAMGKMQGGMLIAELLRHHDVRTLRELSVRFRRQVWPDDVLRLSIWRDGELVRGHCRVADSGQVAVDLAAKTTSTP